MLHFFVSSCLGCFVSSFLGCFVSSFLRVLAASFLRFFVSWQNYHVVRGEMSPTGCVSNIYLRIRGIDMLNSQPFDSFYSLRKAPAAAGGPLEQGVEFLKIVQTRGMKLAEKWIPKNVCCTPVFWLSNCSKNLVG